MTTKVSTKLTLKDILSRLTIRRLALPDRAALDQLAATLAQVLVAGQGTTPTRPPQ